MQQLTNNYFNYAYFQIPCLSLSSECGEPISSLIIPQRGIHFWKRHKQKNRTPRLISNSLKLNKVEFAPDLFSHKSGCFKEKLNAQN